MMTPAIVKYRPLLIAGAGLAALPFLMPLIPALGKSHGRRAAEDLLCR